jgi:aryl sulfotransferase
MKILQAGEAKSGNYWLYNIIDNIYQEAGISKSSYITKQPIYEEAKKKTFSYAKQAEIDTIEVNGDEVKVMISDWYNEQITDIDTYIKQVSHVWTHSICNDTLLEFAKKMDKVVYIVRDPRDVAISKSKFAFTDYHKRYRLANPGSSPEAFLNNRLPGTCLRWNQHVASYLKLSLVKPVHFIFFENMKVNFKEELEALLKYLEISLSENSIDNICKAVHIDTLKKKDPTHVRKGTSKQWVTTLSDEQKTISKKISGGFINFLGYDTEQPKYPNQFTERNLLDLLSKSRGTLIDKLKLGYGFLMSSRSLKDKLSLGVKFIQNK